MPYLIRCPRLLAFVALICWACVHGAVADTIVLHLKNGDRVTGTLVSDETNRVVITTPWQKDLAIPKSEISSREALPAVKAAPATNAPAPPVTPPVVAAKPAAPALQPKPPKHWNVDLQFGLDVQESTKSRMLYYNRSKLSYGHVLNNRDPIRSVLDFNYSYGKTEGIRSTDQMAGSSKTDYDLRKRLFLYNLGGAGYDKIRRIDLQFEEGPGVGYHLVTRTNFVLNTELGMNYQSQEFSDGTDSQNVYFRVAEDMAWKINKDLDFIQKIEFFPQADTFSKFRFRFDSTIRYALLQNLSLNLSVIDFYDSRPAAKVEPNDLQIRSSIGVKF